MFNRKKSQKPEATPDQVEDPVEEHLEDDLHDAYEPTPQPPQAFEPPPRTMGAEQRREIERARRHPGT